MPPFKNLMEILVRGEAASLDFGNGLADRRIGCVDGAPNLFGKNVSETGLAIFVGADRGSMPIP